MKENLTKLMEILKGSNLSIKVGILAVLDIMKSSTIEIDETKLRNVLEEVKNGVLSADEAAARIIIVYEKVGPRTTSDVTDSNQGKATDGLESESALPSINQQLRELLSERNILMNRLKIEFEKIQDHRFFKAEILNNEIGKFEDDFTWIKNNQINSQGVDDELKEKAVKEQIEKIKRIMKNYINQDGLFIVVSNLIKELEKKIKEMDMIKPGYIENEGGYVVSCRKIKRTINPESSDACPDFDSCISRLRMYIQILRAEIKYSDVPNDIILESETPEEKMLEEIYVLLGKCFEEVEYYQNYKYIRLNDAETFIYPSPIGENLLPLHIKLFEVDKSNILALTNLRNETEQELNRIKQTIDLEHPTDKTAKDNDGVAGKDDDEAAIDKCK